MPIAWPVANAPFKFLLDGANYVMEDNRYIFKPAAGKSIMRRKTSLRTDMFVGAIVWTPAQFAFAENFYTVNLADGSLTFTAPHPFTAVSTTMQFKSPMEYAPYGPKLKVTFELELIA